MQNRLILQHVKANQLPSSWIKRLHAPLSQKFTVRIEAESTVRWEDFAAFRKTFGKKKFPSSTKIIRSLREDNDLS